MILGMSRRGARLARHARRKRGIPALNLVSLMDIFTILVFFLLVNSSNIEVLPNPQSMQLPESLARQLPRDTLVLMVTEQDILVGGHRVMSLAEATAAPGADLPTLKAHLMQAAPLQAAPDTEGKSRGEINIMADRDIPYSLLKKIMLSCTRTDFHKISLAVTQREPAPV